MRPFQTAIVAFALCICASSAAAQTMQIAVDGQQRKYVLVRPLAGGPSPTILVLHGLNGTAEREARGGGFRNIAELAPQQGFAVVFAEARGGAWNRFLPGTESKTAVAYYNQHGGVPNDIGYLQTLVAGLVRQRISDPARIYIAGGSNGGFMTMTMICTNADLFAGVGILVSSMTDRLGEACRPTRPLPAVIMNGTADTTVPYGGGLVAPPSDPKFKGATFGIWSTDRLVLFFRRLNGCEGQPERSMMPGPQRIEVERASKCAGGPVLAYRVIGGTHGSTGPAVNSGRALLDFFRDSASVKPAVAEPRPTGAEPKPARPPVITPGPKIAIVHPNGLNFIAYRRKEGSALIAGALRRMSGNEWIETNTRGGKWTFRSTAETDTEIALHDASRDIHLRADLALKRLFVRQGASPTWELHSEIVRADR